MPQTPLQQEALSHGQNGEQDVTADVVELGLPDESSTRGIEDAMPEGSSVDLYVRLSQLRSSALQNRNLLGMHTIYLGESFLLTYVVRSNIDTGAMPLSVSTLQLPLPTTASNKADSSRPLSHLGAEDWEILRLRGALTLPEKGTSDALVKTFFEAVYPAFPIFDKQDFALLYEKNQISLLVLNAIFALSSTLCGAKVNKEAGFDSRSAARKAFLKRARALYDTNYEKDKISLIQATFIFSFLWDGPNEEKDMWYWLGIAISFAQAKGLHRSTKHSILRVRDRRLWKRIWWSLYVRDRHCSGTLGRPMRIRDGDCDIEPLEERDFVGADDGEYSESDTESRFNICGRTSLAHVRYAISMSRLAVIFGNIISTKFPICLTRDIFSSAELVEQLKTWRQQLLLRVGDDYDEDQDTWFWARMLDLSYNHLLILLHRPEHGNAPVTVISPRNIALLAANRICRIVDELIGMRMMRQTQLQICPSVFAALAIYTVTIRYADKTQRELVENRARIVILGLSQIAETWPASSWILRLFEPVFQVWQMEPPSSMRDQQETTASLSSSHHFVQEEHPNSLVPAANEEQQEFTVSLGHPTPQLTGGVFEHGNEGTHRESPYVQPQQSSFSLNEPLDAELLTWFPDDWLNLKFPDSL